jgi:hypothetical protein
VSGVEVLPPFCHTATFISTVLDNLCSQASLKRQLPVVLPADAAGCYTEGQILVHMVHHITNVIKEYQDKLRELLYVPKTPYQRDSLG